jgi:carboxybiotin decarboxylase
MMDQTISTWSLMSEHLAQFVNTTSFANFTVGHLVMIAVGLAFIYMAIAKEYEPMLLIPIGFGILLGNIPFLGFEHTAFGDPLNLQIGIHQSGSVLNYLYSGVLFGIFPPLIFLGIGAMTDFSSVISNPKLILIGIAAQIGIFGAYTGALALGFLPAEAGSLAIIGAADGPTAIFLASKLAPGMIGIIAISAYCYMAMVPVIQPRIMKVLTTPKERLIRMKPLRTVSKLEKTLFPIIGLLLTCFIVPAALPLLGMLFFGNLLKESTVTKRLAETVKGPMIDIVTILIGLTVGASTQATTFLTTKSVSIFVLGFVAFSVATFGGIIFVKIMNLFLKEGNKINPLIGNAGVAALPDSARVSQIVGLEYDSTNHLLIHAMGPNVSGLIGSAIAAGVLLSLLF